LVTFRAEGLSVRGSRLTARPTRFPSLKQSTRTLLSPRPTILLSILLSCSATFPIAAETSTGIAQSHASAAGVSEGRWGRLEYFEVLLEPPTSHLWANLYSDRSIWAFGERTPDEAIEHLKSLKISPEVIELVKTEGKWQTHATGLELQLSDAIIEATRPEDRKTLSAWFFTHDREFFNRLIVNLEGRDFSAFEGKVSAKTLELIKSLTFERGKVLSIMDRAYVIRKLGTDEAEKVKFLRALFSTRSLVVRLAIDESTDLEPIVDYWSRGGINPGVKSILEQVKLTEGVDRIDIVHLLPPLPRRYLFGFTNLLDVGPKNTPDCFWTSIQFFKRNASPRMLDPLQLNHYINFDFEEASGDLQFGDIVCMFDKTTQEFIHSYVQISDDIVFTKNGASYARPYVLGLKSDMLSVYLDETEYLIKAYRRKAGI